MPPTNTHDSVKLTNTALYLIEHVTDPSRVPSYRKLYKGVQDGLVPAVFVGRDRWVKKAHMPLIADLFGLKLRTDRNAA